MQAFRERRVEPLLAGGVGSVRRFYPSPGSRPAWPLELLVAPGALPDVRAACVRCGWRPAGAGPDFARFVEDSGSPLVVYAGAPVTVAGPLGPEGAYEALREEAAETPEDAEEPLALAPADELIRLCTGGARTVLPPSLQWLIDVHHVLVSAAAPPVDRLQARVRRFRALEPLRATLLYLADTVGPAGLEAYLDAFAAARGNRRERLAHVLAGAPAGRLVAPAQLVAAHLRASADGPPSRAVTRLPRHLQETWRTASRTEAIAVGLRKTARLLR